MNRSTRFSAWLIISAVALLTAFFLLQAMKVDFSGSVSDLVVSQEGAVTLDGSSPGTRTDQQAEISEQLVMMIELPNQESGTLVTPTHLSRLKTISNQLQETGWFSYVTSIAGFKLPRSSPPDSLSFESKQRKGLRQALLEAEKIYRYAPRELPKEIIFKRGDRPQFPVFRGKSMSDAMGFVDNFSVWENLPGTTQECRLFSQDLSNSVYLKNFISQDFRSCALIMTIKSTAKALELLPEIRHLIKKLNQQYSGIYQIFLAGNILLQDEMRRTIAQDTVKFLKIGILLIFICYGFAYRTLRGVLIPFLTLVISEVWVLGMMGLTGHDLNIVLYIVPVFVLAVGSSATIHMLSKFYALQDSGVPPWEASILSARELLLPIGSASATTAFGFAALTISSVKGLNTFVYLCVFGLAVITFLSLVFIPAMNILLPAPRSSRDHSFIAKKRWEIFSDWVFRRSGVIALVFLLLGLWAASGIYRIDTDNDLTKLLKKDSRVLRTSERVSSRLAGTTILTITLESTPGWCVKKENLLDMNKFQRELENSSNIDKTTSMADILMLTHSMALPGKSLEEQTQYEINSHLHIFRAMETDESYREFGTAIRELTEEFASPDFSKARIQVRSNLTSLKKMNAELERIRQLSSRIIGSHVKITISGGILDVNRAVERILLGQTKGVILSLMTIFLLMLVYFFSLKISVLSIIPNIFPILFFYGSLGIFDIGLDLSSGLVACVAIGISVDDTIHFMTEMRRQLKGTYDSRIAIHESHHRVGGPMILTSLVLAVFFGILTFSRFPVMSNLGWLMAGTMLLAMISNIMLLPALLARVRLFGVWEMLKKYNFDPTASPLFAGMSRLGIKTFLSMGRVMEFHSGQRVFDSCSGDDAIHIIIEGKARIVDSHGNPCKINPGILEEGQAFGKLSDLNHHLKNISDESSSAPSGGPVIQAEGELKTVVIDGDFLEIASTFSPRICNRFLMNLIGAKDRFFQAGQCPGKKS